MNNNIFISIIRDTWQFLQKVLSFAAFNILRLKISDRLWQKFMQFVKFGLVGLSNTVISYALYLLLIFFDVHYIIANAVGFAAGIINSFFWNSLFVFKKSDGESRNSVLSFFKTSVVYIFTGLVLTNILLYLEVDIWGWSKTLAPAFNLLLTIPLNFILSKFWAFRVEK